MTPFSSSVAIDLNMDWTSRLEIAGGLARLLSDTYSLSLKVQNYHWNVTGPLFAPLHLLFEAQHRELALAADDIAERIRALGVRAPGSLHEFAALTSLREEDDEPTGLEMLRRTLAGHRIAWRTAGSVVPAAVQAEDRSSLELLTERLESHELASSNIVHLLGR